MEKNKFTKSVMAATIGLIGLFSINAHANVIEIGEATKSYAPLTGFGKSLPLVTVLNQVVPGGWKVKKGGDKTIDIKQNISWNSGSSWVEVLKDISKNHNISFVIDWKSNTVFVSNSIAPSTESVKVNNINKNSNGVFELDSVEETTEMKTVSTSTVDKQVNQKTWNLIVGKSLKENIEQWFEGTQYTLEWNAVNYEVKKENKEPYVGELDSENGPIAQLAKDYGFDSNAKIPLSFQFWANNTLVVENLNFKQSESK